MAWGDSGTAPTSTRDVAVSLPPGFTSIKDISDEKLRPGTLTNICGMVKDFRPPISMAKTGIPVLDI